MKYFVKSQEEIESEAVESVKNAIRVLQNIQGKSPSQKRLLFIKRLQDAVFLLDDSQEIQE